MSTSYRSASEGTPFTTTVYSQSVPYDNYLNGIAIAGIVLIGVLLAAFSYFHLFPLFLKPPDPTSRTSNLAPTEFVDTEAGGVLDQSEKKTLIAWMRRRSRGRFIDTTGSNRASPRSLSPIPNTPTANERLGNSRMTRFFSRISVIPHIVPISSGPAAYPIHPITPMPTPPSSSAERKPSPTMLLKASSPPAHSFSQIPSEPCVSIPYASFFPGVAHTDRRYCKYEPKSDAEVESDPGSHKTTPTQASLRTASASPSVRDSELHPRWITRLLAPSRAMVMDKPEEIARNSPLLETKRSVLEV